MPDINLQEIAALGSILAVVFAFLYTHFSNSAKIKFLNENLNRLASDNHEAQLSAAILLRRFLRKRPLGFNRRTRLDAINTISSILRVLPTGIYQKTLGDGLAYAGDLSRMDMQRTNLQDLYIGKKVHKSTSSLHPVRKIRMRETDFHLADLSYALIENVDAKYATLYDAILLSTNIKYSDFSGADFRKADLTNVRFVNTMLLNANFAGAKGIPPEIVEHLNDEGICSYKERITTERINGDKKIFFSMPGTLTREEEHVTLAYKQVLENMGYEIIYYSRDHYPKYGQLNKVQKGIKECAGIVAFGFVQISVSLGKYYPAMPNEIDFSQKYLATPWNDIEVGMALMRGLPILLVCDPMINMGVFDKNLSETYLFRVSADCDVRNIINSQPFTQWIARL